MLKFFRLPFATSGDKTAVPDAADPSGLVSYTTGYTFDYQRQKTDPAAKDIERDKMNEIFFDITNAIAEIQGQGVPDFITSALNGGSAYSYPIAAVVRYSNDLYVSLVAANTALPSDATKWALLPTAGRIQAGTYNFATAGGTADAITVGFTPALTALTSGIIWWRATAANATTTPTIKRDGLAAKTLVKGANTPLAIGDIPGAGAWMGSIYDATLDKEVLINPAQGVVTAGRLIGVQIFNTAGTSTYTPTPGTASVVVEVQGGGGAGGGAPATAAGQGSLGSGGGAGAFGSSRLTSGFSGVTVTVGAGGTGNSGAAGGNGGTSSFGALVSAPGGNGGAVAGPSTGFFASCGNSANATGGNLTNNPGQGSDVSTNISAGSSGVGKAGASKYGPGAPSVGAVGGTGAAAVSFGSGGGGTGNVASSAAATGGAGKNGIVTVWEYA